MGEGGRMLRDLPRALDRVDEIADALAGRDIAVFLDYDGTLTPIVDRPEDARLPAGTRRAIEELTAVHTVAVISGRDLDDVRRMVGVKDISYAGSHGFDIIGADGARHRRGEEFLPALEEAERELEPLLGNISGARLERKRFAIAVHFRQVDPSRERDVEDAVTRVDDRHPNLRRTGGKKIFELRPAMDWDKGRALRHLMEVLALKDAIPIYVGDDETDEDAFRAIADDGVGVVVRGEDDDRPTAAHYVLSDPDEARELLGKLSDIR